MDWFLYDRDICHKKIKWPCFKELGSSLLPLIFLKSWFDGAYKTVAYKKQKTAREPLQWLTKSSQKYLIKKVY